MTKVYPKPRCLNKYKQVQTSTPGISIDENKQKKKTDKRMVYCNKEKRAWLHN